MKKISLKSRYVYRRSRLHQTKQVGALRVRRRKLPPPPRQRPQPPPPPPTNPNPSPSSATYVTGNSRTSLPSMDTCGYTADTSKRYTLKRRVLFYSAFNAASNLYLTTLWKSQKCSGYGVLWTDHSAQIENSEIFYFRNEIGHPHIKEV